MRLISRQSARKTTVILTATYLIAEPHVVLVVCGGEVALRYVGEPDWDVLHHTLLEEYE